MALLFADLEQKVCVASVRTELVEVILDPANKHNFIIAKDGPIRDPKKVCRFGL